MAKKLSRRVLAQYYGEELLAGKDQSVLAQQLGAYLIDSKRTKELELIVQDIEFYLASKGVVMAEVTSAFELSSATEASIKQMITDSTGAKEIHLHTTVERSVLGGVKISIPGKELDSTAARKLSTLRTEYKKA